jgi:hypothetical protein
LKDFIWNSLLNKQIKKKGRRSLPGVGGLESHLTGPFCFFFRAVGRTSRPPFPGLVLVGRPGSIAAAQARQARSSPFPSFGR